MATKIKVTTRNKWRKMALVVIVIIFGFTLFKLFKKTNNNKNPQKPQLVSSDLPLKIPEGFRLAVFADLNSIGAPRVLTFDQNGVLLVSIPEAGKVIALPDDNGDGVADRTVEVEKNLNRPHGITVHEGSLYIAETDKVRKFGYGLENKPDINPQILFRLPSGGGHWTRTIRIHNGKLYTSIGSSCNVCLEDDEKRSAILVSDLNGDNLKIFAKGLRNTVFFTFKEDKFNGWLMWGNDMGRDMLGDNLPPDELNIIAEGRDYGWPYCYGGRIRDVNFEAGQKKDYCITTQSSHINYPAHVAPLGLTFIDSLLFPKEEQGNLLVAYHGSWNSTDPVGYKIVKLQVNRDDKAPAIEDFITGFIESTGQVIGRPVDLVFAQNGDLFISDDEANLIYRLYK